MYRDHRKGSRGPLGGSTCPRGPYGLNMEGNQPLGGLGAKPPLGPMRLGLGGNPGGGAPLAWGASLPPLAAAPPLDPSRGGRPPSPLPL